MPMFLVLSIAIEFKSIRKFLLVVWKNLLDKPIDLAKLILDISSGIVWGEKNVV
jgi:hypothetical protein